MQCHGLQCGFCTPGMMITARALLDRNPDPDEDEIREAIFGPDLPVHRLHHDRALRPVGRQPCECRGDRAVTTIHERPPSTRRPGRQRPEAVWARPDAAQGGPAVHPRPWQLRRRRASCPACCIWRSCARRTRTPASCRIDVSAAQAHPKVKAVVTGADLAEKGLAWMPTLSNDVQAVLATDKVRFQGQEVAFVVAEDRYSARDALELIDVEYDPLDPVIDARKALDPDAAGDPHRPRGQDRQPLLRLGDRRRGGHRCGVRQGRRRGQAGDRLSRGCIRRRWKPAARSPISTRSPASSRCGRPRQAPHAHRTLYALVAGLPEHKIRVISPDIGGGFGNKVPIYPGYVCAIVGSLRARQAGQVDGGPQREPDQHRVRPRLHHGRRDRRHQRRQDPGDPVERARRPRRVQRRGVAGEVPGRLLRGVHRQLRHRGRVLPHDGGVHQQGAGRGGLRLLVPHHRGGVLRRAAGGLPGLRDEDRSGRAAAAKSVETRAVSVQVQDRLGVRLR